MDSMMDHEKLAMKILENEDSRQVLAMLIRQLWNGRADNGKVSRESIVTMNFLTDGI